MLGACIVRASGRCGRKRIKCNLNVEEDTHTILMTFAFDSTFELMPEPLSKVVDYHSSSITLRQELASPKILKMD